MLETPTGPASEGLSSLERMLVMKKLPTYGTLPNADLAVLAEVSRERFFPKGSLLLAEGEAVPAIYLIVEGRVQVSRGGRVIGTVAADNGIGGLGLLAGDPYGVDARALEDTLTLELEADLMFELFEDRFAILHHILRDLSRQMIDQYRDPRISPAEIIPGWEAVPLGRDLDLVERIFFLRKMLPFRKAGINALAEVSRALTQIQFEAGTVLWREGEPAHGIYLVLNGRVRCRSAAGQDFAAGPGFPLGALEAVAEAPRWYGAVAETRIAGLQGPVETLVDVFEDNFDLARLYLGGMAQGLIRILERRLALRADLPRLGLSPALEVTASPEGGGAPPV